MLLALSFLIACRDKEATTIGTFRDDVLKIQVTTDGVYRLTPDMLQEAGLENARLTAESVRLREGETTVPYLIDGDNLIFYGQAPASRYTAVRTYLLETGVAGEMMTETAVATNADTMLSEVPVSQHLEQNKFYEASPLPTLPPDEQDVNLVDLWFWATLDLKLKSLPLTTNLTEVDDGSGSLTLRLWGQSENPQVTDDHDLDVVVNGQTVGTVRWDGRFFHEGQLTLPPGTLQSGDNTIILDNAVPGASFLDIMLLDWLSLTYMAEPIAVNDLLQFGGVSGQVSLRGFSEQPLLFDTSDGNHPRLLTEWSFASGAAQLAVDEAMMVTAVGPQGYLAPAAIMPVRASDWHNSEQQADLIILTTDELAPALAPLVAARQEEGLGVALVPVAEIYDEFGNGDASPTAITNFITYAMSQWQTPQPRYLFLVGDATVDYRDYLGLAPANVIPSPLVPVQYSGETVSDSRLVDVDGDKKPDLAVGRWPVSEPDVVANLVERTLTYEAGTAVDRVIFATDATESQFASMAQRLTTAAHLTSEVFNGAQAAEVAAQFNQGAWLATYIGHGSVGQWGKDNVFTRDAAEQLNNSTPPIVLQLTCLTGLFAHPQITSLSETMLTQPGGPLLLVAATSLTLSSHQEPFATAFVQALQAPDNERIGDAFQQAKLSLAVASNNGLREISDTFVLLGDPSAHIVRP